MLMQHESDEILEGLLKIPIKGGRIDFDRVKSQRKPKGRGKAKVKKPAASLEEYAKEDRKKNLSDVAYKIANIKGERFTDDHLAILLSHSGYLMTNPIHSFGVCPVVNGKGSMLCNITVDPGYIYITEIKQWVIDKGDIEHLLNAIISCITDARGVDQILNIKKNVEVLRERQIKRD